MTFPSRPAGTLDQRRPIRPRHAGRLRVGAPATVEVRRLGEVLDGLGLQAVDAIKIDTEGSEFEILKGFRSWLADRPPRYIYVECIDDHLRRFGTDGRAVVAFLEKFGYKIYRLSMGYWRLAHPDGNRADAFRAADIMAERPS